jgi:hypothetical protein
MPLKEHARRSIAAKLRQTDELVSQDQPPTEAMHAVGVAQIR